MAATVSTRQSTTNSPHLNAKSMTSSPRSNRNSLQAADALKQDSAELKPELPTIKQPDDIANGKKETSAPAANAPLAPPPRPSQNGDSEYFAQNPHLSTEPNPFENAFGNPAETPGKTQLPGVTSLTSPASLLPGITPNWAGSLRQGPLSPAMLTGPTGSNDYFNSDHHFGGSFPTPNESSLRSGLTPGGGGSMFPQPSPNSQALYNQLQSGGATPGTLDFHRTAMTARAQTQSNTYNGLQQPAVTSAAQQNPNIQPDLDSKPYPPTSAPQDNQDPFGSHQTNDAANGLFMLAQAGGQQRNTSGYPMQQQSQQQQGGYQGGQDTRGKGSIGSTMSGGSTEGGDQFSEEENKTQTRGGRGKKGAGGKAANGKRKTEDTPVKGSANKRQRGSNGNSMSEEPEDDDMMQDDHDDDKDKKMTDEEKRKNFLERNRVAALKCRQRKKQWLANLQQKVEIFSTENDALAATVTQLREEIVGLKTLLLAHKDCPVSQAQGISGLAMQQIAGDAQHYANPYGMGGPGMGQMQQNQMQQQAQMRR